MEKEKCVCCVGVAPVGVGLIRVVFFFVFCVGVFVCCLLLSDFGSSNRGPRTH